MALIWPGFLQSWPNRAPWLSPQHPMNGNGFLQIAPQVRHAEAGTDMHTSGSASIGTPKASQSS